MNGSGLFVSSGKHFNFEDGILPTSDPTIWNVGEMGEFDFDEDKTLRFDDLYGMVAPIDLTAFESPNGSQPMQVAAPPVSNYLPNPVQFLDLKPNFQLASNNSASMPVLPTQNDPLRFGEMMHGATSRPSLSSQLQGQHQVRPPVQQQCQQVQQHVPMPKPSYAPLQRHPQCNGLQNSPACKEVAPVTEKPLESDVVTFVDLNPYYEKGQCRLQGKSEQRLDYGCSFVRIYLQNPENIKAKAAFVERSPDAAHILKDNLGRVPLKILPDESPSWIKVNLDDAGSEVYKLSKVKGEERNRFRIVLELLFKATNQRKLFYSETFQVKSKPKSTDNMFCGDAFEDGEKPTIKIEPSIKTKGVKRSKMDEQDALTTSPGSVGSSIFPEVITDHLQAVTADIEQLKVLKPIQTQRGDVAYHFKLNECPAGLTLEEGDIIGFFANASGKSEIRRLTCENVHQAKLAGVISRSAWLEGKMPDDKEKDPTDLVCVIGVVKVKVRGPVDNGERIYASLSSFPGVAMPENVITQVTSNELTLMGQSLESAKDSPPDQVNLVSCFVSILLSIQTKHTTKVMSEMRSDVLGDVDTKIAEEKRRFIHGLRWKIIFLLIFLVLLGILLYQLYAPSTAYRYWKCKRGSISGSTSSFTYTTFNFQVARIKGVEFHFDKLMEKIDRSGDTNRKEEEETFNSGYRYYLNLHRCAAGGLKSGVHGPKFYVMDTFCNTAYYLHPNKEYRKYITGTDFLCSFKESTAAISNEKELDNDSFRSQACYSDIEKKIGNASFNYISSSTLKKTYASGIQVTFDVLNKKTKHDLTRLQLDDKKVVRYFYNIDRCMFGAGGPRIFAIVAACNNSYYYSKGKSEWSKYRTAKEFKCWPGF